jgi:hypothetical protein
MKALALAWPRIVTLFLKSNDQTHYPNQQNPTLTLQALVPLVIHCKHLKDLTIYLSARSQSGQKRGPEVINHALTRLSVVDSPIDDPKGVAAFLTDIYPRIDCLNNEDKGNREADNGPITDLDQKWTEVEELLATFVAVRSS